MKKIVNVALRKAWFAPATQSYQDDTKKKNYFFVIFATFIMSYSYCAVRSSSPHKQRDDISIF